MRYPEINAYSLQINLKLGNVDENLKKIKGYMENVLDNSLLVLPEMFSSGFDNEKLFTHSKKTPQILKDLQEISKKRKLTIIGTLPENIKGKIFNRAFVIDNGEVIYKQSKIKLFKPTGEDKYFSAGRKLKVINTSKGKIGILICFELRFPELAYKLRKGGVEIIVVPAQWGKARKKHFEILSKARSIEEQAFLISSNTTGKIGELEMAGSSGIYSPWGETLDFVDEEEKLISAKLNIKDIYVVRRAIKMY